MTQSDLNISALREQFLASVQAAEETAHEGMELLWEAPRSPAVAAPATDAAMSPEELAATVASLQQRTTAIHAAAAPGLGGSIVAPVAPPEPEPQPPALPRDVALHLQRLRSQASKINDLAYQQALAIQEFKRIRDRIDLSLHRGNNAYGWHVEQFCRMDEAVLSQVVQDNAGALILSQGIVDLYADERDATQTAQTLRERELARSRHAAASHQGWQTLIAEPLAALAALGQAMTRTLERRSRLTPLDICLWLGGGLIARQGIELLLAAAPSLWPLFVGGVIAAVAYSLYRLMITPRMDIGLVSRVGLALLGLVLGGHL